MSIETKSQRFFQRPLPTHPNHASGVFFRGKFHHLEIERLRSRVFTAENFRSSIFELHSLPHYHIALYTDGTGSWIDEQGKHQAQTGNLLLIPPYYPHMILACQPTTYRMIILTFRYRVGNDFLQIPFNKLLSQYISCDIPDIPLVIPLTSSRSTRLEEALEKLLDATLSFSPYWNIEVDNAFNRVMSTLHMVATQLPHDHKEDNSTIKIDKIKQRLDRSPESAISLDELAEQAGMSKEHLIRMFKKHFGIPPGQYRQNRRLEKAVSLLLNSDKSIGEIADIVGYENIFYFSRVFKRSYHMSPQHFRTQISVD